MHSIERARLQQLKEELSYKASMSARFRSTLLVAADFSLYDTNRRIC